MAKTWSFGHSECKKVNYNEHNSITPDKAGNMLEGDVSDIIALD